MDTAKYELTEETIKKFKKELSKAIETAKKISLNLQKVEADVKNAHARIPDPPKEISDRSSARELQAYLQRMQILRRDVARMYFSCMTVKGVWSEIIEASKSYIMSQPEVANLKNDTIRMHVVRQVIGVLLKRKAKLSTLISILENLQHTLRNNQDAALGQLSAWKEETWAYKQGIEA